jgi:phospholipid/cholesterol/gamma-HCH transport system substrate-binding protein
MTAHARPPRAQRVSYFKAGLIALALIAVATYFMVTKEVPFRDHYEVKAAFKDSSGLRPGSPVRLAGVEVGEVKEIDSDDDGEAALVTMRMRREGLPVHRDATFKIRPRLFLEGNFFVDVEPGTPAAPELGDGETVGVHQTATPVQLHQVLTALDSDTREQLSVLLDEYGRALRRGSAATNRTAPYWKPAYRDSAIVSDAQRGERPDDLSTYLRDFGKVAAALDRDPQALRALVTDFHRTARGFAREDLALERTVSGLARVLRVGMPALRRLNRSLPSLRRLVADARPAVRSSAPALQAGVPLARELRGALGRDELGGLSRELSDLAPPLARLNRASVPLSEEGRALASCQNEIVVPWSNSEVPDPNFPAVGKVHEQQAQVLPGLSGESRSGDANGQWFRVLLNAGNYTYAADPGEFFQTAMPILGVNPPTPKQRPPLEPNVPCETQERADLGTVPGAPPQPLRVGLETAAARKRAARAQKVAIDWLRDRVKYEGLDDELRVTPDPITRADLGRLRGK